MDQNVALAQSHLDDVRQAFDHLGEAPKGDSDDSHLYIQQIQALLGRLELARACLAKVETDEEYPNPKDMAELNANLLEGKLHRRIVEAAAPLAPIVPSLVPFKEESLAKSLARLKNVAMMFWIDDQTREELWWEVSIVAYTGGDRKELREALQTVAAFRGPRELEARKKLQVLEAMDAEER